MSKTVSIAKLVGPSLLFTACISVVNAQSLLTDVKAEGNPAKRSKKALMLAESVFDDARRFYTQGNVDGGNAQLEDMTNALNLAVSSLMAAHQWPLSKKAELKVARLQRRLHGLVDNIALQQRGWAEYTERQLDEIHNRLLEEVIKK